jgi:cytidylate kinase
VKKKLIVTIDGPAGSGKSTTAKLLSEAMGYTYLDTGAMYRAMTLMVLEENINPSDSAKVLVLLPKLTIRVQYEGGKQRTFLNGRDVSEAIRRPDVTQNVSAVSSIRDVRQFLVAQQREIGKSGGYVIDGRDAGTVIFPDADVKFFLTASIAERARRRMLELKANDAVVNLDQMMDEINTRDGLDRNREESPLRKPKDAIEIDNSDMTVAEQTRIMLTHIKQKFPSV